MKTYSIKSAMRRQRVLNQYMDGLFKFEKALKEAKPLKGKMNDWQYINLKKLLPDSLHPKEYDRQIKRICDKINH